MCVPSFPSVSFVGLTDHFDYRGLGGRVARRWVVTVRDAAGRPVVGPELFASEDAAVDRTMVLAGDVWDDRVTVECAASPFPMPDGDR